jgi:hypothetical protein
MRMKKMTVLLLFFAALTLGCERKTSTTDVKENLTKAMTAKLQNDRPADAPPLHFEIVDVAYYLLDGYYRCEFKVKLRRPDGTDTTGMIKSRISADFARVIK